MFIVAEDYNTLPYAIPNLDDADNAVAFEDFVEEQEEKVLRELLGDVLYEAFVLGLEAPVAQRWTDLKDGVGYDDENGKTRKWKGMKAMLKPYIFARWVATYPGNLTGGGVVVVEGENSTTINPSPKISEAFLDYKKLAGTDQYEPNTLYQYLYLSEDKYLADIATEADTIKEYVWENFEVPGLENEFDF